MWFQVLNRTTLEVKTSKLPPLVPPLPAPPLLPQHVITCGIRKDCIRLRGLPYEAQVEHILEFLGDYAKNIVYQGVHMVYNAQVFIIFIWFNLFGLRKWFNDENICYRGV